MQAPEQEEPAQEWARIGTGTEKGTLWRTRKGRWEGRARIEAVPANEQLSIVLSAWLLSMPPPPCPFRSSLGGWVAREKAQSLAPAHLP